MIKKRNSELFVPRITKLDACEIDKEIHNLLKNSLMEIVNYLRPGSLNNLNLEIDLLIKLIVFKYSVLKSNSTFGQQLQNIKYHETLSTKKAAWFLILNYILPYIRNKHDYFFLNQENNGLKKLFDKIEIPIKVCQFVNLLFFLRQGTFPNLVDRLLGIEIVPNKKIIKNVGYNYITRELIWYGFMELLMYVIPLINYHNLKMRIVNIFQYKSKKLLYKKKPAIYTHNTKCCICKQQPIYPCRVSVYCEHIACYYCIKSNILAERQYSCSDCGMKNTAGETLQFLSEQN